MSAQPPNLPFGDPTAIKKENSAAVLKGLGVGCGGCSAIILIFLTVIAGVVMIVLHFLSNSDPANAALSAARSSPEVQSALGTPIEKSWPVTGNLSTSNDQGTADLTIPIKGPKNGGTIHAIATKSSGSAWMFTHLEVRIDGETPNTIPLTSELPAEAKENP
jgi:hypothetical protein